MKLVFEIVALSLVVSLLSILPAPAHAASSEAEFTALLKERKTAEAEALARTRIAADSKDDMALWFLARIASGDAKKRDELIPKAEQCAKDLPQSARCQSALGTLFGSAALSSGMMGGLKYLSRIKEALLMAVELDPRFFDARRDLNQFYLQAPGLAGGSVRKAFANADDLAKLHPAQGALLRAEVHIYEKEFDLAEAILDAMKGNDDAAIGEKSAQAWAGLGFALINDGKAAGAAKLFERRLAVGMENAVMHFGLGRAQLEVKQFDAAIASFERALKLNEKVGAHYRLGIAYQAKGDKPRAVAAFQQFLSYQSTGKAVDDARLRLDELRRAL